MLRLEIASLKSGVRKDELTPSASDLELDENDFRDIRVIAHLDRDDDRVHVRFEVQGVARLQCDRTLVDFDQEIDGTGRVLYVPASEIEELGGPSDDVQELPYRASEIDVTAAVRDILMLSIPLRRIAPGAEDVELSTSFGAPDDDVDPRWEALKRLRGDDAEHS
jgi:uncharacterized protein